MQKSSMPVAYVVKPDDNITDDIFADEDKRPDAVGLKRKVNGTWMPVTWREFAGQVRDIAAGFIAAGIQPGDRVALMSHTRFEWTLLDYAILTAGGITVPIYPTSSLEQVEWILGDSGAVAVVVETDDHAEKVATARPGLPALTHVRAAGALAGRAVSGGRRRYPGAAAGLAAQGPGPGRASRMVRRGALLWARAAGFSARFVLVSPCGLG